MTIEAVTEPGTLIEMKPHREQVQQAPAHKAAGTFTAPFDTVKGLLSGKPLKRPCRLRPIPTITNQALQKLAEKHPPPAEWFDGEDERPF